MSGFGSMDHMVKSYRSNRALLKGRKKSLKSIYQENNYYYIKKKINAKTEKYDPEQKRIFLKKFYSKQKKARTKQTFLFLIVVILFVLLFFLAY